MEVASKPLTGKSVMITRSRKQAGVLRDLLSENGATIFEVPAIEIVLQPSNTERLKHALQNAQQYRWLLLTSSNSVGVVDDALKSVGMKWEDLANLKIGCIGKATAAHVRELGGKVALVPAHFQAEGLIDALAGEELRGARILLPRAEGSRPVLPQALEARGAVVDEIHIYRAELPESSKNELERILSSESVDFITFTSSSTVHHFVEMAGQRLAQIDFQKTRIASIGPITSATLKEYGLPVSIEAKEFTIPGLVSALIGC